MKTRNIEKYHRSVKENRFIYVIHAPHCNDFFIWHCKKDLWKASYKRHIHGQRKQTADLVAECAKKGCLPCFHVLEEVHLTQITAYKHVIAWTQILYLRDYEPLAGNKTLFYMTEMQDYTESVFNRNKNADLDQLLSCGTCLIDNCPRKPT